MRQSVQKLLVITSVLAIMIAHNAQGQQEEQSLNPATWLIEQYQGFLSEVKADTCAMYPSCSEYGRLAYERYPFWMATLITCDLINRSDHDSERHELVRIGGRKKHYAPLPGDSYDPALPEESVSATAPIHPVDVILKERNPNLSEEEALLDSARYLHALGKQDLALTEYLRFLRQ